VAALAPSWPLLLHHLPFGASARGVYVLTRPIAVRSWLWKMRAIVHHTCGTAPRMSCGLRRWTSRQSLTARSSRASACRERGLGHLAYPGPPAISDPGCRLRSAQAEIPQPGRSLKLAAFDVRHGPPTHLVATVGAHEIGSPLQGALPRVTAGCNVREVSEWAGHNSVAFTLTRYAGL
jgi:hypothetical protein